MESSKSSMAASARFTALGSAEHVDNHFGVVDGAGDLHAPFHQICIERSDLPITFGGLSGFIGKIPGYRTGVPFLLPSDSLGKQPLTLGLQLAVELGDETDGGGDEDPFSRMGPGGLIDLDTTADLPPVDDLGARNGLEGGCTGPFFRCHGCTSAVDSRRKSPADMRSVYGEISLLATLC